MTIPAPALRRTYPLGGRVTGPAWRAAWDLFMGGGYGVDWQSRKALLINMISAADCAGKTADALLSEAVRTGILEQDMQDGRCAFRVSRAWLAARKPPASSSDLPSGV